MIDGSDGETSCCSIEGGGGDGKIGLVFRINVIDGSGVSFDDHEDEEEDEDVIDGSDGETSCCSCSIGGGGDRSLGVEGLV